jgi:hypothetical protein
MTKIEYKDLSARLQNLSKKIPLNWGKVQNDSMDKLVNLFNYNTFGSLENKIKNMPINIQNYFRRRWFLYKCSQVDEYLFYQNNNVKKNPKLKDQSWDISINNSIHFDIKSTVVPKSLRSNFIVNDINEKKIIDFYYKNQSKGVRYKVQNRLFIVHHSYKNNERNIYLRCHWKLKEIAYLKFINLISDSKINLIKYRSVFSKCIFIIETKNNDFHYKII